MNTRPFVVLMAEDSEDDVIVTKRAWKKHSISNHLHVVSDGEDCLDYLFRRGKFTDPTNSPTPGIVLLDIKMPKMDGITTLRHIRENESTRRLPVIMLTTSKSDEDRIKCYDLGVNAYIMKPVGFNNFAEAIKNINIFWQLVEFPN